MTNQLTYGAQSIELPPGLYWSDELQWQPVAQSVTYSATGRLLVQTAARNGGRPITLAPIAGTGGVAERALADALQAWACVPGGLLTLTWAGTDYPVQWRHDSGPALAAEPLWPAETDQATDLFRLTLRLMTRPT